MTFKVHKINTNRHLLHRPSRWRVVVRFPKKWTSVKLNWAQKIGKFQLTASSPEFLALGET